MRRGDFRAQDRRPTVAHDARVGWMRERVAMRFPVWTGYLPGASPHAGPDAPWAAWCQPPAERAAPGREATRPGTARGVAGTHAQAMRGGGRAPGITSRPASVPTAPPARRRVGRTIQTVLVAVALAAAVRAAPVAADPAKTLFGAVAGPSPEAPAPIGSYAAGCIGGAVALPETGPGWQAVRLSRNRTWGHPAAIAFVERLAPHAQAAGWPGIYVGDISQPRGGPMRSGHRSHQIGLDIDIWLSPAAASPLSRAEREAVGAVSLVRADRRDVTGGWSPAHHAILRAAATDPAVARIFVNAAIKRALCRAEPADADRDWLANVRPWWGHDAHFHVRLACPDGAGTCQPQEPIPPGDGCGADLDWWFTDEALNPAPTTPTRPRDLTLADLPAACRAVLAR